MGPTHDYILQIHPTRRCNLRCLHCYSASGPDKRDLLDGPVFAHAIRDAFNEGYRVASFSGGEPTLYRDLPTLLHLARSLGMTTTVTSNGMLLDKKRLDAIAAHTNVLAISLDGIPESHNRMRGSPVAFETMLNRLDEVRASRIPFGFIFTLTQRNVNEMEWAAEFAASQGASLFQIHPLEDVGRATTLLRGERPDDIESAYAYVEAARIREAFRKRMTVQLDLVHREVLRKNRDRFADFENAETRPLADLISPLVIEADGRVSPFGYGFARAYSLGSLLDASLSDLSRNWRKTGFAQLRYVCQKAFEEASVTRELPILNWWDTLDTTANSQVFA